MAQSQGDAAGCEIRHKGGTTTTTAARKHTAVGSKAGAAAVAAPPPPSSLTTSSTAPCGACKFLRRKCIGGCIFAPHFSSDQGAARFAAVHKVFGASNVSKLLLNIPVNRQHDAVVTISYEAQARLSDPVYGCVSTILALKQQVASLQAELAMVQAQLVNSRLAVVNALQTSEQQQETHISLMMQPAYSNNSSASNNLVNMTGFVGSFKFGADGDPSSHSLEPFGFSSRPHQYEEDEEESQNQMVLANQIIQP